MKSNLKARWLTLLCMITCSISNMMAQSTMTSTVLVQPCNNNGQIGVTVTGLSLPVSYTYTNWYTNQTIVHANINSLSDVVTNLPAYQFVNFSNPNVWGISASSGANSAFTSTVLTPAFSDTIKVFNAVCPALGTVQATNFTGGTPPFTCVWTNTATALNYNSNPAIIPNGIYTVVITDGAGCKVSSAAIGFSNVPITVQNTSGIFVTISGTQANCTNGTATATAGGGTSPYTYLWSNSAVTQTISGLSQGYYTCVATDAIGCVGTGGYNLTQAITINYNSSITNAVCTQTNGSIISFVTGGTTPYTFLWSNGATTQNISNLAGGLSYFVQITDANGCTGMGSAYVNASTPITVTYTSTPSSCTSSNGSATITPSGGAAPYTTVWYSFPSNTTGLSIANKPSGNYYFNVTDANGCVRNGFAFIPTIAPINASINNASAVCPATTASLQVSVSGSNPPYTYQWSNAAITSAITNAPLGYYTCTITNAAGCTAVKSAYINQSNPITVGFSVVPASCIYSSNGAVTAIPFGGTSPYAYAWSGGQTGATATGLAHGNYYVSVTDANGCINNYSNSMVNVGYNALNNACYCTITGTVYTDVNSNCIKNVGEVGIPNVQIHCSGYGYAYTNANGVYSFMVPSGTYTITQSVQMIYPLAPCQSNNQTVTVAAASNCTTGINFANNVLPIHDLHIITTNQNFPIPGNPYQQRVIVQNEGTMTENTVKVGYQHDGQLSYNNAVSWSFVQQNAVTYPNWYSINTGFTTLNPGSNSSTFINYNVPVNIPLGTVVNFKDTVAHTTPIATTWLTDNTPWNNVNSHQAYVVGSYDPNFKEVTPRGVGTQGGITNADSALTYVVHFQNTGTYYAQNIVVTDTIDSDLNLSSLRPGYSDHSYTVTMSDNGIVKFNFNTIHLPWKSAYGDVLSSGMFTYSIKLKKNLTVGTQIKNKAAIYFDFNEPVITNTTLNTIMAPTNINELKANSKDNSVLFPNPATQFFNLVFFSPGIEKAVLSIYDLSGREVMSSDIQLQNGENSLYANIGHLQNGIYLVQLKSEQLKLSKKLVVSK